MKKYANDQIIIHWFPDVCAHPGICLNQLPEVFNLSKRPWINVDGATPEEIITTIDQCPSGALKYSLPEGSQVDPQMASGIGNLDFEKLHPAAVKIKTIANGPLLIEGSSVVLGINGKMLREGAKLSLCRCGLSLNRPFCDGAHKKQNWQVDQE